ncbi:lymphocyte antigen 6D-like [Polymixia lowei]
MKTVILAVLVLVAVGQGEGLRCNNCLGSGCTNRVETCRNAYDVCARVFYLPPMRPNYFKRCMKESDCRLLQSQPDLMTVTCCNMDLCN